MSFFIKSNPPPAVLIFFDQKRVKDVFYCQISIVYALLVTCAASLFQQNITRFHATVAATIASSPVSFYFLFYSIEAFWYNHRLDTVLGKEKYLNRGMVFFAAGMWTSIVVYTSLDSTQNNFTQSSCETETVQEIFVRVVINPQELGFGLLISPWFLFTIAALFSWLISIWRARKDIWPPGGRSWLKFRTVW